MNIAMLNERVTFQKNEVVTDRIGNHTNAWTDYYTCSATISGENGREEAGPMRMGSPSGGCMMRQFVRQRKVPWQDFGRKRGRS